MNYIGSKYSLLPFLTQTIEDVAGADLSDRVFCDLFAGTGIVGRSFKTRVRQVIANDWEYYSYVLNRNYIGNHRPLADAQTYIDLLNAAEGDRDGFIYANYCWGSGSQRQYFTDENGQKIDAARRLIERWKTEEAISDDMYYFLLCSLLESADRVANTASVYGAYLKHIKQAAAKPLHIQPAEFTLNCHTHQVFCQDANVLISQIAGDILYLDPPYNARQYGANYHLLNTIAEYRPFTPKGKTGLREYTRSRYCGKGSVSAALDHLIKEADFRYIFLSYNNEGLMSMEQIRDTMSRYGHYDVVSQTYTRFRADKEENRNHAAKQTTEYLHILEKR